MNRMFTGMFFALVLLVGALASHAEAAPRVYYAMPYPYATIPAQPQMYYYPTMPASTLNSPTGVVTTFYGPAPAYVSPPAVLMVPRRRAYYYEGPVQFWSPTPPAIIYPSP